MRVSPIASFLGVVSSLGVATFAASLLAQTSCGSDGHGEDEPFNCDTDTRADNIVSGLEKMGARGVVTFRLMGTSPAPPKRPDNNWVVSLESNGAPVEGATVGVKLFMPDHDHGTSVKPKIGPAGAAGEYTLDQLNLWMPGLWEVTIEATPSGGTKDSAVFRVCIPE